jgi:hypothetical protein
MTCTLLVRSYAILICYTYAYESMHHTIPKPCAQHEEICQMNNYYSVIYSITHWSA